LRIHRVGGFDSWDDFDDLERQLREAIEKGLIEKIPAAENWKYRRWTQTWYRDKEKTELWYLIPPNPPARGSWLPVDLDDILSSTNYRF